MYRKPVKSSNVKSVGYDEMTMDLEIEFITGAIYRYSKVPEDVYVSFMTAPSIGSAIHQMLRGKYETQKVGG